MQHQFLRVIATSFALMAVVSCKERPGSDAAAGSAESDVPGTPGADTASTTAAMGELTDANIVALLDEANQADSASGAYALTKATSPDVRAYAKLMIGEHHALRLQGQQLAKKLNITPQAPANDPLPAAAKAEMDALRSAPKGQEFDRTYIEQEIGIHKAVMDLAGKAHGAAENQELKKLIEQASPVIQRHLQRAEEIQKKLGKPTA
jgi:putative membrane protein